VGPALAAREGIRDADVSVDESEATLSARRTRSPPSNSPPTPTAEREVTPEETTRRL
jgi:hypothetical protein